MADPLSIAASIVELLTAALQDSQVLNDTIKKARHAPDDCKRLKGEVDEIRNILGQLQLFILRVNHASRSRTSLLMVDQVVAILSSCVLTFSDLQVFAEGLQSEAAMGILERVRWMSKETELKAMLSRLDTHKSSLSLMLIILTCQLQIEAESKVDRRCDLIEAILGQNPVLADRLAAYEPPQEDEYTLTTRQRKSDKSGLDALQNLSVSTQPEADIGTGQGIKRDARGFAFEELLMNSRAYRNAASDNSDAFSIVSSAGRTASWSMLSGLSLSEMSNIAILALPIYATDINNKDVYDFEPPQEEPTVLSGESMPPAATDSTRRRTSMKTWLKGVTRSPSSRQQAAPAPTFPEVFGRSLDESVRLANVTIFWTDEHGERFIYGYVPMIIAKIGVFLKERGTDVDGIFRISGNSARMLRLQKAFDNPDHYGKNIDWTGYTVHDATGVLLRFLKALPEPVIPYEFYSKFTAPIHPFVASNERVWEVTIDEQKVAIATLQKSITELPPVSRQLLVYLLDIMAVLASKEDLNRCTVAMLSSVFHPSILSKPPAEMDAFEYRLATNTTIFMIENQHRFLFGIDTPAC